MKARVTNFKSVLDSGWFQVGELTCLVGKNESGKTAILEALERLGSVVASRSDFEDTQYPRMNFSEYEESTTVDTALETEWELSDDEHQRLCVMAGDPAAITSKVVGLSKDYANKLTWSLPVDYTTAASPALKNSSLNDEEQAALAEFDNPGALLGALGKIAEPTCGQTALRAERDALWSAGSLSGTAIAYLMSILLKFVYYSQYDRLPGRISLDQLLAAKAQGTLDNIEGARVFLALLAMVGTTPELINEITTSENLISKLEAVEGRLSKKIFTYWSQNKSLKVRFRFDQASPGDPAPFNSGKIFQTRIYNSRHEVTIRLDERSTGFIWFFSFLVWFSQVQREFGDRLIVLLDEPGLTLHARAQGDLLRYMKTELLPKHQVLCTTHSPFMIDPADLLSCRTVEDGTGPDGEVLGTKVGDKVLSADNDTIFPLQAALDYDITQTLFVGMHCLLVEGPSDLLYLRWASDQLTSQGRTGLDARWTITPVGGITKVPTFVALLRGSKLHVAVLTDYGQGDRKKVAERRESTLVDPGHVITADAYAEGKPAEADIEDIFGRKSYIDLVASTYGLTDDQKLPDALPAEASIRVTAEVEAAFRLLPGNVVEYHHFAPSRYLIEHPSAVQNPDALDRFELLFRHLNSLL